MASNVGDLQLAVLAALVRRYGPIPCIHVAVVRQGQPPTHAVLASPQPGMVLPPLSIRQQRQEFKTVFRCEASELRVQDGSVVLTLAPLKNAVVVTLGGVRIPLPETLLETTMFGTAEKACEERDRLCAAMGWLPWDLTPLGQPLDADDAAVALRHVQADAAGVKVLPESTEEISAWTFENPQNESSQTAPRVEE